MDATLGVLWQRGARPKPKAKTAVRKALPRGKGPRTANGQFLPTGKPKPVHVAKAKTSIRIGGLKLLVAAKRVTHYRAKIDYGRMTVRAQMSGAAQYQRRLAEELAKRGLA